MNSLARPSGGGTFRSLRSRNYALYVVGQAISRSGTWVQLVAENWLVLQLGGGGVGIGVTTALYFSPLLVLGPYAGVLVDRADNRRLLTFTQSANGLLALALGLLALGDVVRVWMVWAAALAAGCVNALDNPSGQALTKELVGLGDVANATALNTAIAGGALLAGTGPAVCFLVNAASYGVVVAALRMMNASRFFAAPPASARPGQLREGFRYVRRHRALWTVLVIVAIVNTFGFNYQVLLTTLVARAFHQGPASYGVVMSTLGVGWLLGSLLAAGWTDPTAGRVGALAAAVGLASAVVAAAATFAQTVAVVAAMGVVTGLFLSSSAGYLQLHAREGMRGRIMALYFMAFLGVSTIGGPLMGWVAEVWGPRMAFLLAAAPCVAAGALPLAGRGPDGASDSRAGDASVLPPRQTGA